MLHIIYKTKQKEKEDYTPLQIIHYFGIQTVLLIYISMQLYRRYKGISRNPCLLIFRYLFEGSGLGPYEDRVLLSNYFDWLVVHFLIWGYLCWNKKDQNGVSLPFSSSWEIHIKLPLFLWTAVVIVIQQIQVLNNEILHYLLSSC